MIAKQLCWKEYREQRSMWLAIVIVGVLCVLSLGALARGGIWHLHEDGDMQPLAHWLLVSLVVAHGVICGAQLLAGEKETGTQAFLDMLAPRRTPVWQSKLASGCLLTLTQALVLASLALLLELNTWLVVPLFLALAWQGLLWGMTGAVLVQTVIRAILVGIALMFAGLLLQCVGFSILFQNGSHKELTVEMVFVALVQLALAALGGVLSWRVYCATDQERGEAAEQTRRTSRRSWLRRIQREAQAVGWLAERQGGWFIAAGLVVGLITGFFVEKAIALLWPAASLLIGLSCGLRVFAFEQPAEQERFLGALRLPPGRIWLWKTSFWAVAALGMLAMLFVVPFFTELTREVTRNVNTGVADSIGIFLYFTIRHPWLCLTVAVVPGFCFGQFFALLSRRIIVTTVLAATASVAYLAIWMPTMILGGLKGWQYFAIPILMLIASRFTMWTWFSGTIYTRRHILGLIACGLLALVWLTGSFWMRFAEIPDVGVPFDLAEFNQSLTQAARQETGALLRQAAQNAAMQQKKVAARLGPPTRLIFQKDPKTPRGPGSAQLNYWTLAEQIMEKGWPPDDAEMGRWLDDVFEGTWPEQFRKVSTMPPGLLVDPRSHSFNASIPEVWEFWQGAYLLDLRALQLQAKGQDGAALDHLETTLALSRLIRHDAIGIVYFRGVGIESNALSCFDGWLQKARQRPDLLRRGLAMLRHHEALVPDVRETIKAQYVLTLQTMENDLAHVLSYQKPPAIEITLARAGWEVPWEHERQLRLINAVFTGYMDMADKIGHLEGRRRHGLPLEEGPTTDLTARQWEDLLADAPFMNLPYSYGPIESYPKGLVRVRICQLLLALAWYEADNHKAAAKLADLVPRYLPAVPRDPYRNQPFFYKVSKGERVPGRHMSGNSETEFVLLPGQGLLWLDGADSTRPKDRWYFPVPQGKQ